MARCGSSSQVAIGFILAYRMSACNRVHCGVWLYYRVASHFCAVSQQSKVSYRCLSLGRSSFGGREQRTLCPASIVVVIAFSGSRSNPTDQRSKAISRISTDCEGMNSFRSRIQEPDITLAAPFISSVSSTIVIVPTPTGNAHRYDVVALVSQGPSDVHSEP
jgi:hypothetical protein